MVLLICFGTLCRAKLGSKPALFPLSIYVLLPLTIWHVPCLPLLFLSSSLSFPVFYVPGLDLWTDACRCLTVRGCLTSSTAACGDGPTCTATTSCAPSTRASSPSTSRRTRCASTPTTTSGWRHQVDELMLFSLNKWIISWVFLNTNTTPPPHPPPL